MGRMKGMGRVWREVRVRLVLGRQMGWEGWIRKGIKGGEKSVQLRQLPDPPVITYSLCIKNAVT